MRQQGNREQAAASFKAASTTHPHNLNIQVELARDLRALNRLSEADAVLNSILTAEPTHIGALVERGHLLRQQGDRAQAAASFKAASTANPHNLNIQVELARDLRALNRLSEADAVLNSVLGAEPRHKGALVERGHLFVQRGYNAQALTAFESAATIDPKHIDLKLEIAKVLRSLGRFGDAESALRRLVEDNSNYLPALMAFSSLLIDTNQHEKAETLLNQAIIAGANSPRIIATLGHSALRRGDAITGLRYLRLANEIDPTNVDVKLALSAALRDQEDFGHAIELVKSVLIADSEHYLAWIQLGQLYRLKGDTTAAISAFRTAFANQPHRPQALVELAHVMWATGQPQQTEQLLKRALCADPIHLGALLASAEFALQVERPEDALQLAQTAIEFHPGL